MRASLVILLLAACHAHSSTSTSSIGLSIDSITPSSIAGGDSASVLFSSEVGGNFILSINATALARGVIKAGVKQGATISGAPLAAGINTIELVEVTDDHRVAHATANITRDDGGGSSGGSSGGSTGAASGSSSGSVSGGGSCTTEPSSVSPTGPVIFFTDLIQGPNTGGETAFGSEGALVTIYGLRLGDGSASTVTIGGVEVGHYIKWNQGTGARGLDSVAVQIGNGIATGTQDVQVVVNGVGSNTLSFAVLPVGNIYLVDLAAATDGNGGFATPWNKLTSIKNHWQTNDIVYVKGTTVAAADTCLGGTKPCVLSVTAANSPNGPVALIGYPGAAPTFKAADDGNENYGIYLQGSGIGNYTIANLTFSQIGNGIERLGGSNRFVGITGTGIDNAYDGFFETEGSSVNEQILGCKFTDSVGSGVDFSAQLTGSEIGWCEFSGSIDSDTNPYINAIANISALTIHDNLFITSVFTDIALSSVVTDATVYNNASLHARANAVLIDPGASTSLSFDHNTWLNADNFLNMCAGSCAGSAVVDLENNVVYASTYLGATDSGAPIDQVASANNLFYDNVASDAAPAGFGTNASFGNPLIAPDATNTPIPTATSPARNQAAVSAHCADYLGVVRPQGSGSDLGAVEVP